MQQGSDCLFAPLLALVDVLADASRSCSVIGSSKSSQRRSISTEGQGVSSCMSLPPDPSRLLAC